MPVKHFITRLAGRLQDLFSAAAFAEEGEAESARRIVQEQDEFPAEKKKTLRPGLTVRNTDRLSVR
jgi:hypothetical protein